MEFGLTLNSFFRGLRDLTVGPTVRESRAKLEDLRSTWHGHDIEITRAINAVVNACKSKRGPLTSEEKAHYQELAATVSEAAAKIIRDNSTFWQPHTVRPGSLQTAERLLKNIGKLSANHAKGALLRDVYNLIDKAKILFELVRIGTLEQLGKRFEAIQASVEMPDIYTRLVVDRPLLGSLRIWKHGVHELEKYSRRQNLMTLELMPKALDLSPKVEIDEAMPKEASAVRSPQISSSSRGLSSSPSIVEFSPVPAEESFHPALNSVNSLHSLWSACSDPAEASSVGTPIETPLPASEFEMPQERPSERGVSKLLQSTRHAFAPVHASKGRTAVVAE